jgi:hypothetical protein
MTITGTPPTKTIGNPPPVPPRRAVLAAAAGLIVVAAVSITPWLLPNGSRTETNSIEPTSAAASPQQPTPAPGHANAGQNVSSVAGPAAYVRFCARSPSICAPSTPTLASGYLQFCWNSPTLCVLPKRN